MADSVESFLKETGNSLENEYELGFTFSFPVRQTGINSGELYLWSKEFNCRNTQGNDVVRMLNDAFKRNVYIQFILIFFFFFFYVFL